MNQIKVGLLPLYIKLYDDSSPHMRVKINAFHKQISNSLKAKGLDVVDVPVCRVKPEFETAVSLFEDSNVDAIVTLHLAYSPSLESADVLARTDLPIIVLDTTPDYAYNQNTPSEALSYNHGIHGVQDMCNLLRRNGKPFEIFAGHWEKSDVLDRVVMAAKGARITKSLRSARVGIVGEPFRGMGDFSIPFDKLEELIGMEVVKFDGRNMGTVTDVDIENEYQADKKAFELEEFSRNDYNDCTRVGLGVRNWIKNENLTAFTMNFLSATKSGAFSYMPFCEASKAMANGIGYAGEGDVMTAALVGALMSVYEETTFTEMFCPDWEGNSVFLSHMGEFNLKCADGRPVLSIRNFKYTDAGDPTSIIGSLKSGKTLFVNLVPEANDAFTLILAEGEMLEITGENKQAQNINGWFKPRLPIADFLEAYSKNGGIHHAAMVYGGERSVLTSFAHYMGWNVCIL